MTDEERDLLIALSEWAVGTGVCETLSPKGKAVREKMDKLRNVAPPKPEPVLHERWVTVWGDGTIFGPFKSRPVEEFSGSKTIYIPWMSDGSPVEEDPVRYGVCETCVEKAVKSADEWRTKAEALQVEVDRLRTDRNACLDQINALNNDIEDMRSVEEDTGCGLLRHVDDNGREDGHTLMMVSGGADYIGDFDTGFPRFLELRRMHDHNKVMTYVAEADRDHWKLRAEAAEAARDEAREQRDGASVLIGKMRPVVEAAVAWEKAPPTANAARLWGRVTEAVRAYEAKQAEPVAKECHTCKWGAVSEINEPCSECHFPAKWEPRHD